MSNEEFKQKTPDHFLSRPPFKVIVGDEDYQVKFDDTYIIVNDYDGGEIKHEMHFRSSEGKLEAVVKRNRISEDQLTEELQEKMLKAAEIAVAMHDEEVIKPAQELLDNDTKRSGTSPEDL